LCILGCSDATARFRSANRTHLRGCEDFLERTLRPGLEPGGLNFAEIDELMKQIPSQGKLVGRDIAEVNPCRDPSGRTAQTAIRLMIDLLAAAF
jgi:arginase family enzyme